MVLEEFRMIVSRKRALRRARTAEPMREMPDSPDLLSFETVSGLKAIWLLAESAPPFGKLKL